MIGLSALPMSYPHKRVGSGPQFAATTRSDLGGPLSDEQILPTLLARTNNMERQSWQKQFVLERLDQSTGLAESEAGIR